MKRAVGSSVLEACFARLACMLGITAFQAAWADSLAGRTWHKVRRLEK